MEEGNYFENVMHKLFINTYTIHFLSYHVVNWDTNCVCIFPLFFWEAALFLPAIYHFSEKKLITNGAVGVAWCGAWLVVWLSPISFLFVYWKWKWNRVRVSATKCISSRGGGLGWVVKGEKVGDSYPHVLLGKWKVGQKKMMQTYPRNVCMPKVQ